MALEVSENEWNIFWTWWYQPEQNRFISDKGSWGVGPYVTRSTTKQEKEHDIALFHQHKDLALKWFKDTHQNINDMSHFYSMYFPRNDCAQNSKENKSTRKSLCIIM